MIEFVYSLCNGHLDYCHILAVMNTNAIHMNKITCLILKTCFKFLWHISRNRNFVFKFLSNCQIVYRTPWYLSLKNFP